MRLMVCLLAITACRDTTRGAINDDTPRAAINVPPVDAATATLVDAAAPPACRTSWDCGDDPPGPSDCMHSCSEGRCQLLVTVRGVGDACDGEMDGDGYMRVAAPTSATRIGFCDPSRGIYCDGGRCTPRKRAGSRCHGGSDFECVNGTYCNLNTEVCSSAPFVGGECGLAVAYRCASNAYCEPRSMRCKARRGFGARCKEGAECRTNYCDPETLRCALLPARRPCAL